MNEKKLGLWLLAVGNAFAIWSAFNPSIFTLRKFAQREGTPEDLADVREGMLWAGVVITAMLAGVWLLSRNSK